MSSARRSPRAIHQRDYVPSLAGSNGSPKADLQESGAGPWSPTTAHRPELTFNPLVPESHTLPGGGVLQWSPGVPRNPERDHARKFDDLHDRTPPADPPQRPTVAPPKQPSERQSTGDQFRLCTSRTLQLLSLLGAGVMTLTILNPTWVDGINPFRDTAADAAPVPPVLVPPTVVGIEPVPQLRMHMEVVGADSCEAAGCSSIAAAEECAAAATDVYCNVASWYCSSGTCDGDPVAVSRTPSATLAHAGGLTTYMPYCSISIQAVQRMGRPPAPTPTVNFRSDPEIPPSQDHSLSPRCSSTTKCVCDCQQLIQGLTEPDQQWWCQPAGQERDEARRDSAAAISDVPSPGCEPDWPSCSNHAVDLEPGQEVNSNYPDEDSEPGREVSDGNSTAKSSGSGHHTAERTAQPAVAAAIGLLLVVYHS